MEMAFSRQAQCRSCVKRYGCCTSSNHHSVVLSRSAGGMTFRRIAFICFLLVGDAICLAANPPKISKIISRKENGHIKTFSFGSLPSKKRENKVRSIASFIHSVESGLRATFLPSGYPGKTPQGYLQYSAWSWIQDLSTSLRGVLATQRVLEGVGVGREGATALSALMNFIVRDGCGMAATLLFTYFAASRFNSDVKRWRLLADVMVDIGITLEVAAIHFPRSYFLPMLCLANVCKAICGVAAGACGGAINLHWAKGSDISDINAKFGAQHTVTGSLGLIFAAVFAKSVANIRYDVIWLLYGALTILHIFANIKCMRLVAFDSFNTVRLDIVLKAFLDSPQNPGAMLSPREVSSVEPLFFLPKRRSFVDVPIRFGVSFNEFWRCTRKSESEVQHILSSRNRYCVSPGYMGRKRCVLVALKENVEGTGQIRAYVHAALLAQAIEKSSGTVGDNILEMEVSSKMNREWLAFESGCRDTGWCLGTHKLKTEGYELSFLT